MRQVRLLIGLVALIVAVAGAHSVVVSSAAPDHQSKETKFKVRVENISPAEGLAASDGTRWPFAISPGFWVVSGKNVRLFTEGKPAGPNGLEAQAEDGNPAMLQASLGGEASHAAGGAPAASGVFNMPVGRDAPGPILPGGSYEFTFTARPGMKLQLAMMFGQSNDLFYAPYAPIALFDSRGAAASGDFTSKLILWDAGTEVNQEPGVGADQAPRQKAPNTGAAEGDVVRRVKDGYSYPETGKVMRVTITPLM
ncbi:MAG TPA: spondin domain-containing protein [Pyrinomonadaceae bacterium]|nr:spondin domain-containing protein [Pyrinomonadaceae bacterium]